MMRIVFPKDVAAKMLPSCPNDTDGDGCWQCADGRCPPANHLPSIKWLKGPLVCEACDDELSAFTRDERQNDQEFRYLTEHMVCRECNDTTHPRRIEIVSLCDICDSPAGTPVAQDHCDGCTVHGQRALSPPVPVHHPFKTLMIARQTHVRPAVIADDYQALSQPTLLNVWTQSGWWTTPISPSEILTPGDYVYEMSPHHGKK